MRSPSQHPPRLRDIAEKLGVSTMTVSLALRAHPSISKTRIAEVQAAAREMDYRPNAMASALAHRKWTLARRAATITLAWLNRWDDPRDLRKQKEFDLYWKGAADAAGGLGYLLKEVIWNAEMSHSRLRKILLARNIPGIVIPPHATPPDWTGWNFEPFSLVRIGHSVSNLPVHVITADQVQGSLLAFREARKRGYQRIGLAISAWAERNTLFEAGFLFGQSRAAAKAAIPVLHLEDTSRTPDARDISKLETWIRRFRVDAIISDVGNLGHMLATLKIGVPENIGLAMLSTAGGAQAGIDQNSFAVGKMAVEILVSQIQRGERGIPPGSHTHLVAPAWVDGTNLPIRPRNSI
jgi:DNA-binding LacI/PurR family transcriptional regulator